MNVILDDLSNSYEMRFFDEALSGINLAYLDFVLSRNNTLQFSKGGCHDIEHR